MYGFLGEIECKIDPKGRLAMPGRFIKQMPAEDNSGFVINRGIEKCLTLYTLPEWDKVSRELEVLNLYDAEQRLFLRQFFRGATEVMFDASNRILLPKRLKDYAGIENDVILLGYFNRIEIWATNVYDEVMEVDAGNFAALANKVMGKQPTNENSHN